MNVALSLNQIFSKGSASLSNRWIRCDFFDKELFAHGAVRPQYWPGFGSCMDIPGLDPTKRWDGILSYYGHVIGFQGSVIDWSDVNDFTNYIPVAATIQDIALTLAQSFTQPAPGVETGWIFFNESTYGMVPDMFIRLDYPPYYNFYEVNAVSLLNRVSSTSAPFIQSVIAGKTGIIFLQSSVTWATATTTPGLVVPTADSIGFLEASGSDQPLQIISQSANNSLAGTLTTGFSAPAVNSTVTLQLASNPGWQVGDYLSIGGDGTSDADSLNLDIYLVTATSAAMESYVMDATSDSATNTVTSAAAMLPSSLVIGSVMLGQFVQAISGSSGAFTITLTGNASDTITAGVIFFTSNPTITIQRMGQGSNQLFAYPAGTYAVTQPYVQVQNNGISAAVFTPGVAVVEAYGLKLTLQNLTGIAPVGSNFVPGTQLLSLNANEAGQVVNAGDRINGPIWAMATSGLYAVIMKERSFQSMQYVGTPQIFNIWPEFSDEGLLGRNTWCKVGENTIYFWGHRAFFQFASGSGDPTPIGQKHFVKVLSEIDLTRISEACMYHKEDRREVWFVYPVQGYDPDVAPSRVFIYNYEQGSISIDDYAEIGIRVTEDTKYRVLEDGKTIRILESESAQSPVTAIGSLPVYTTALRWEDWKGEWRDQLIAWSELTGGRQFITLMGLFPDGETQLVSHGAVYNRSGEAYYSEWISVFHDGGDEQLFKYLDLIQFSISIKNKQTTGRPFRLYVQPGTQANLDGEVTWATPQWVDVSGNSEYTMKKNFNVSGRLIGVRWYSEQADCQWRIASYALSGRMGGTY